MYELTTSQCQWVGGGTGSKAAPASPSTSGSQVCTAIAGGGSQCTSNNGRSMVINTYDRNGNLTQTAVCTESAAGSVKAKITPQVQGEVSASGGTSCRISRPAQPSNPAMDPAGQLLVVSPFFYGAP